MTQHHQPPTSTTAYTYDDPLSCLYHPTAHGTEASASATDAPPARAPLPDQNSHKGTTSSANTLAPGFRGDATCPAAYLCTFPTGSTESTDTTVRDQVPMCCFQDALCAGDLWGVNRGYLCGALGYGSLVLCPYCRRVGAV